ncbi:MAG: transposase, partial [Niabella sp.]
MLQPATYYHIYNHANGDDNVFKERKNYPFFLNKYHQHIDPIAETKVWCLMPNHFHLLVRIKDISQLRLDFPKFQTLENLTNEEKEKQLSLLLSKQFSNFFSSYTQSFNKVYGRRGSLFIKNFKRKEITSERYLQTIILYIHLNAVKHGFCKTVEEWEWTSYPDFWQEQNQLAINIFQTPTQYETIHKEKQILFDNYLNVEDYLLNT